MIHQRHRWTDRQTDDMRSQDRALHYSASCSKNKKSQSNLGRTASPPLTAENDYATKSPLVTMGYAPHLPTKLSLPIRRSPSPSKWSNTPTVVSWLVIAVKNLNDKFYIMAMNSLGGQSPINLLLPIPQSTPLTTHPRRHPDPISRFVTVHPDRPTDR